MNPNLSAAFYEPLWRGDAWLTTLPVWAGDYEHEIRAFGGFWAATVRQAMGRQALDGWLADGLGRHVRVYDDALALCWEGFVNRITAEVGGEIVQVGPLLDVSNRVAVTYTPLIPVTDPPQRLEQETTAVANDTDSQDLWGIMSSVFSGGELTDAAALQVRAMLLAERAYPATTRTLASAPAQNLSLEMLGYCHLLRYPYTQTATLNTVDLSDDDGTGKLQLVLAADPNGLVPADWSRTVDNTLAVPAYEDQGALALDLLQEMVVQGDASLNRYLFGLYDDRQARYEAAPTEVEYVETVGDYGRRIYTPAMREVRPWNVRPGKWLLHSSFLVGAQDPTAYAADGRFEFLEVVRYRAPGGLEYESGYSSTIDMVLAQRGLAGVYA